MEKPKPKPNIVYILQSQSSPIQYYTGVTKNIRRRLSAFVTFGIYSIVWTVKSKRDMNALGAGIPTTWLLLVPFANLFYLYKYAEGFAMHVKKDNATALWFVIQLFVGFVMPFVVQTELNKFATQGHQTPALRQAA